jgi:hypothetical protein
MAERDRIFNGKVRQVHIFNFKEMYRFCLQHLLDEEYDVQEQQYKEKILPNGKEVEIKWDATRKISDYFKYQIKAKWRILGMNDVEVNSNGKKIKMQKGDVEVKIEGFLVKDYEHRWEDTPFLKFLRGVYNRYIIRARVEAYENKLFGECDEFAAHIKSFLAIDAKVTNIEKTV